MGHLTVCIWGGMCTVFVAKNSVSCGEAEAALLDDYFNILFL